MTKSIIHLILCLLGGCFNYDNDKDAREKEWWQIGLVAGKPHKPFGLGNPLRGNQINKKINSIYRKEKNIYIIIHKIKFSFSIHKIKNKKNKKKLFIWQPTNKFRYGLINNKLLKCYVHETKFILHLWQVARRSRKWGYWVCFLF